MHATLKTAVLILTASAFALCAAEKTVKLPPPDKQGGKPLMQCMTERKSARGFDKKKALPKQVLSNLFYAADGISRADGRKTVPTARNFQNQQIYAATADGIYLYNPKNHALELVKAGDFRAKCGKQKFHQNAQVVLIYVADTSKIGKNELEKEYYAANHAGYASQNVYLYAASEGLATVVCAMVDRDALAKELGLPQTHRVEFVQPVAYPAK